MDKLIALGVVFTIFSFIVTIMMIDNRKTKRERAEKFKEKNK